MTDHEAVSISQAAITPGAPPTSAKSSVLRAAGALLCTLLLVAYVYLPVLGFDFTNWDDPVYVLRNPDIKSLAWNNVSTIFRSYISGNYQPLTMIVHAIEYHLFGLDPRGYHAFNLLLHLITTGLLFVLLRSWTGGSIIGATVGALFFSLHPMRTETVAWIADLKDGLSAAFLVGALLAYDSYLRRGGPLRYGATLLLFVLGLLSKGTSLLFPVILFLCDFLARRRPRGRMILEKLPFFAVSAMFGVLNLAARAEFQNILREPALPLLTAASYQMQRFVGYFLLRVIAPPATGILYPDALTQAPPGSPSSLAAFAVLLLVATAIAFSLRRTRLLAFAALFYLVGIAPIFKVVILGFTADRFAYFPALGLSLPAGVATAVLVKRAARRSPSLLAAVATALLFLLVLGIWGTRTTLVTWRDSIILWTEGLSRSRGIGTLVVYRGQAYLERGDTVAALRDAQVAIAEQPRLGLAWQLRGTVLRLSGNLDEAARSLDFALAFDPMLPSAYNARGEVYRDQGDLRSAANFFSIAIQYDPRFPEALANRAVALALLGEDALATADIERAFALDPDSAEVRLARGTLRERRGKVIDALEDFQKASARNPALKEAFLNQARILTVLHREVEAREAMAHARAISSR